MVNNRKKVTYLYVDGTNLFKGVSELLQPGDYITFSDILRMVEKKFSIEKVKLYSTYFKHDPAHTVSKTLQTDAQFSFLDGARNIPKVEFIKGYFSSSGKEKGIDMKMGVDIVKDCYEGHFDEAIVMTGDDDFIYAINVAKHCKKPIHMATIGTRYGYGTAMNCQRKLILDYNVYFTSQVLPTIKHVPKNLDVMDITKEVTIATSKRPKTSKT